MSRIPGNALGKRHQPTEVMQLEVSKVGRKDEIEVQPAPWIFSGQAGRNNAQEKGPFFGKRGEFAP